MSDASGAFRLFVYGTLRPGHAPAALAEVVATLRTLHTARARGRLYDLGAYPGAVLDAAGACWIHGEIVESTATSPPLAWFDAYEDYVPAAPERSVFIRERCVAETAGGAIECWIYVLAREPANAPRIENGRWEPARR